MMIPGEIIHDGGWYTVTVDALGADTQGRSRKAACRALADLISDYAADYGFANLVVDVVDGGTDTLFVTADDPAKLIALMLRRLRDASSLSLAEVTGEMRAKSRNDWAQYEQGKHVPSIAKLQQMLDAVGSQLVVTVVPRTAQVIPPPEELDPAIEAVIADPSSANLEALKASVARKRAELKKKRSA
jgi:transcriptional regulator with XRE-family HTH domain